MRRPRRPVHGRRDLHQRLGARVDDAEHRAARVVPRGRVEAPVAGVEPDLVGAAHARDHRVDRAVRVHDDLGRCRGIRVGGGEGISCRIEDHAAAEQHVVVRSQGEPGGLAELHRHFLLEDAAGADHPDRAVGGDSIHFGNGDVELPGAPVEDRLLGAVGRVLEGDPRQERELAGSGIDLDQACERRAVGVVHRQEQVVHRVESHFVGAQSGSAAGGDFAHDPIGPQVDGHDAARSVGDEEPVAGNHHPVRSGGVVVAGESLEVAADLAEQHVVSGIDDVDGPVRAIGEEVGLRPRVDEADVEHGEPRNGDGPDELHCLTGSAPIGKRRSAPEEEAYGCHGQRRGRPARHDKPPILEISPRTRRTKRSLQNQVKSVANLRQSSLGRKSIWGLRESFTTRPHCYRPLL